MRFSSVFQLPLASRLAAEGPAPLRAQETLPPAVPAAQANARVELPDDLDQRVRMVGEWQMGEG